MLGDPTTSIVGVTLLNGVIQTYNPVEASPLPPSSTTINCTLLSSPTSSMEVVSAFGQYRWKNGLTIHCADVFYHGEDEKKDIFENCPSKKSVDISSSYDYKILVAHRDQLAVFDVSPLQPFPILPIDGEEKIPSKDVASVESLVIIVHAELLWMMKMQANIVTATLSGDGQVIVIVLKGEREGTPNAIGAHAILRMVVMSCILLTRHHH